MISHVSGDQSDIVTFGWSQTETVSLNKRTHCASIAKACGLKWLTYLSKRMITLKQIADIRVATRLVTT